MWCHCARTWQIVVVCWSDDDDDDYDDDCIKMFKPDKLLLSAGLRQLEASTSLQTRTTSTAPGCHHHYCHHHLHHHRFSIVVIIIVISRVIMFREVQQPQSKEASHKILTLRVHSTASWSTCTFKVRNIHWVNFSRLFASNEPGLFKEKPSIAIFYYLLVK